MTALHGTRKRLYQAYQHLPAPVRGVGGTVLRWRAERSVRQQPDFTDAPVRLLIGPANSAGQAVRWARAVERQAPDVRALNLAVEGRGSRGAALRFEADIWLTRKMQLHGLAAHRRRALSATHVLSESGRAVLGDFHTGSLEVDLPVLREHGIRTGLVFHGSDVRDPATHARLYPHSPFGDPVDDYTARLQALTARNHDLVERFEGTVFVSTPDLLDFMPGATWLPTVVDVDRFSASRPALTSDRPVVLHAPSNPRLKGTAAIDEALAELETEGLVSYVRPEVTPHAAMPQLLAGADIVIDQVVLGNPGVLLAESMAAGRLVIAHLSPDVRDRMAVADPAGEPPPVVEAGPGTLADVLREAVRDRSAHQQLAERGRQWARRNHDGTRAGEVLHDWLRA